MYIYVERERERVYICRERERESIFYIRYHKKYCLKLYVCTCMYLRIYACVLYMDVHACMFVYTYISQPLLLHTDTDKKLRHRQRQGAGGEGSL